MYKTQKLNMLRLLSDEQLSTRDTIFSIVTRSCARHIVHNCTKQIPRFGSPKGYVFVAFFAIAMSLFTTSYASAQQLAAPFFNVETSAVSAQINQIRAQAHLPPLRSHPLLQQAAQLHARDMVTYANWSHIGTDGSRVKDRVYRTGYPLDGWTSENWVSAMDSTSAFGWWMNSPVHRNNILGTHWREFGIGAMFDPASARTIYVAVFATGNRSGSNAHRVVSAPSPPVSAPPSRLDAAAEAAHPKRLVRRTVSTIRSGDTIFGLADHYAISWEDLASVNGWSKETVLQIGEQFVVPTTAQNALADGNKPLHDSYTVEAGDTLISIAHDRQIDWQVIAHINDLRNADMLQIGQKLRLPTSTVALAEHPALHTVQAGETIISLAAHYHMDWKALLSLNEMTESSILQIGQEIRLSQELN